MCGGPHLSLGYIRPAQGGWFAKDSRAIYPGVWYTFNTGLKVNVWPAASFGSILFFNKNEINCDATKIILRGLPIKHGNVKDRVQTTHKHVHTDAKYPTEDIRPRCHGEGTTIYTSKCDTILQLYGALDLRAPVWTCRVSHHRESQTSSYKIHRLKYQQIKRKDTNIFRVTLHSVYRESGAMRIRL